MPIKRLPNNAMLSVAYRIAVLIVGFVLVAVGILGLFLPFLQGFLLIAMGLSVMSLGSERVDGFVRGLKARVLIAWRGYRRRRKRS